MDTLFVIVTYISNIPLFYMGLFGRDNTNYAIPLTIDFNNAALFANRDTAYTVLKKLKEELEIRGMDATEYKVEEHGFAMKEKEEKIRVGVISSNHQKFNTWVSAFKKKGEEYFIIKDEADACHLKLDKLVEGYGHEDVPVCVKISAINRLERTKFDEK